MRTIRNHTCIAILFVAVMSAVPAGCFQPPPSADDDVGTIGLSLQVAPGVTISTISWNITNTAVGFSRSGTVSVQNSNAIRFQVGGLPAGAGYTIALTATTTDGAFSCAGSATFSVMSGVTSPVSLTLTCTANGNGTGSVVVNGSTAICTTITSLSAAPLETIVNSAIALAATVAAGSLTPTFAWTATAGSFDDPATAMPVFTCPSSPTNVTITLAVSPTAPGCTSATRSVEVTCTTLNPTFTNVYTNIIGARCIGCHRPNSSGVSAGNLDMSTQATAYANLVGVASAGTGAGTSGITCVAAALTRVIAGNSAGSLVYNKVASKLANVLAPCGSPMPLPGSGASLTQAQVDLMAAWIDGGALND